MNVFDHSERGLPMTRIATALCIACACVASAGAATRYVYQNVAGVDLFEEGFGINNNGDFVGVMGDLSPSGDFTTMAFLQNAFRAIPPPPGFTGFSTIGINDSETMVGEAFNSVGIPVGAIYSWATKK